LEGAEHAHESALVTKGEPMRGTMLWFNEVKDVGLIETPAGERIEVRGSDFVGGLRPKGRCAGLTITYRLVGDPEGEQVAEDVALLDEAAPRRARMRHGHR